jgi:hypothetical protein
VWVVAYSIGGDRGDDRAPKRADGLGRWGILTTWGARARPAATHGREWEEMGGEGEEKYLT